MDHTAKINIDTKTLVLCALIIIGLVLTFVGLFGDFLKEPDDDRSVTLSQLTKAVKNEAKESNDFPSQWASYTNAFAWCTFGFTIASVVAVIVIACNLVQNGEKIVWLCVFFNLVFAILVFIFSFRMARVYECDIAFGPLLTLFGALLVSVLCLLGIHNKNVSSVDGPTLLLCVIMLIGFVLTTVGLSGHFLKVTEDKDATSLSLPTLSVTNQELKDKYSAYKALYDLHGRDYPDPIKIEGFPLVNTFAWIGFAFSFLCVLVFVAVKLFKVIDLSPSTGLLGILNIVFSILILVFSIVMVNKNNAVKEWGEKTTLTICAGPILMTIGGLLVAGSTFRLSAEAKPQSAPVPKLVDKTDDTLQKMSDLVDAGVLSKEQFEEKKKELEKQKKKLRADENIDENLIKLEELFDAGILSQEDFETKKKELEKRRIELAEQKRGAQAIGSVDENLVKLKELFDAGILSQEDFESKKLELEEKKHKLSAESLTFDEIIAALKQLKELVEAGVISEEELEKKRTEYKPLKKLRGMLDTGILTQEEYEEKKTELLNVLGEG